MDNTTYLQEKSSGSPDGSSPLQTQNLVGTWINTNKSSTGIQSVTIAINDTSGLTLSVVAYLEEELSTWPMVIISRTYAEALDANTAMAFTAACDLGFQHISLEANINMGLLIIATISTNRNGTEYFAREFYFLASGEES